MTLPRTGTSALTDLEREVLRDIVEDKDPWGGNRGVGTRQTSQTISRLYKKGMLGHARKPTPAGLAESKKLPAFPPTDYKGTQADWMRGLVARGLWNGRGFHGDVWLTPEQYDEVLEACEGET